MQQNREETLEKLDATKNG